MLDHPAIVRLHTFFEDAAAVYFVLDLCAPSLPRPRLSLLLKTPPLFRLGRQMSLILLLLLLPSPQFLSIASFSSLSIRLPHAACIGARRASSTTVCGGAGRCRRRWRGRCLPRCRPGTMGGSCPRARAISLLSPLSLISPSLSLYLFLYFSHATSSSPTSFSLAVPAQRLCASVGRSRAYEISFKRDRLKGRSLSKESQRER
jgi:hypothetical protein